jgi:hypothetical protein
MLLVCSCPEEVMSNRRRFGFMWLAPRNRRYSARCRHVLASRMDIAPSMQILPLPRSGSPGVSLDRPFTYCVRAPHNTNSSRLHIRDGIKDSPGFLRSGTLQLGRPSSPHLAAQEHHIAAQSLITAMPPGITNTLACLHTACIVNFRLSSNGDASHFHPRLIKRLG